MHLLLSPLTTGLVLTLLLAVGWRYLPRAVRWVGFTMVGLLILLMCPFGANALVWQIESRVPAVDACQSPLPNVIVVLSGGFEREPSSSDDFAALGLSSVHRLLAGVTLWRRTPGATLVFAGGGPYAISESDMLARFAEQLSVPSTSIRTERLSQTTWENAQQLRALNPGLPDKMWLISSAMHLPRASIAFRAAGFQPCSYVSDRSYLAPGGLGYFVPQSSSLVKSEAAIHEIVGELLYRWRADSIAP